MRTQGCESAVPLAYFMTNITLAQRQLIDACVQTCDPDSNTAAVTHKLHNEDSEITDHENSGKKRKLAEM